MSLSYRKSEKKESEILYLRDFSMIQSILLFTGQIVTIKQKHRMRFGLKLQKKRRKAVFSEKCRKMADDIDKRT